MKRSRILKGGLIGCGALLLSTLGIFASDVMTGVDTRLSNLASVGSRGVCPEGMVLATLGERALCVDMYEASTGGSCPHPNPGSALETEKNASIQGCYPASKKGATPWTFVTLAQAQRLCASAGKRLPRSDEWYGLALGTNPDGCILHAQAPDTTGTDSCTSRDGVTDMVGNVWEWVNETVEGATFNGRTLPQEGYVREADASGIAIDTTSEQGDPLFGDDYFWSKREGTFGMIRGGYYGSADDGGLYTVNAGVNTTMATQGIGFRCVDDV